MTFKWPWRWVRRIQPISDSDWALSKIYIWIFSDFFNHFVLNWPLNDLEPELSGSNWLQMQTQRTKKHIPSLVKSLVKKNFFLWGCFIKKKREFLCSGATLQAPIYFCIGTVEGVLTLGLYFGYTIGYIRIKYRLVRTAQGFSL